MLGYLSFDIICSSKLTIFLELLSWKTVGFPELIMSVDKYPSLFSCQTLAYFRVKLLRKRHKVEGYPQELEGVSGPLHPLKFQFFGLLSY